jgi:DNA ligase-1
MLSGTIKDVQKDVHLPAYLSPKLDGFRSPVQGSVLLSKNLKPIRNAWCQRTFGREVLNKLDGELIVGSPTAPNCIGVTSSGVTSLDGEPDATLWVFDSFSGEGFGDRLAEARYRVQQMDNPRIQLVEHTIVNTHKELLKWETKYLDAGYEGVMLRSLDGPYKQGRSTVPEGWLLKLKVFEYDLGRIIDVEQGQANGNTATRDASGHTKRSTHKANMTPNGLVGGFIVEILTGPFKGKVTRVGAGKLTKVQAKALWAVRNTLLGRQLTFKYFPRGCKDLPRFPLYEKGL